MGAEILADFGPNGQKWLKINYLCDLQKIDSMDFDEICQQVVTKYLLFGFVIVYPRITLGCRNSSRFWPKMAPNG